MGIRVSINHRIGASRHIMVEKASEEDDQGSRDDGHGRFFCPNVRI